MEDGGHEAADVSNIGGKETSRVEAHRGAFKGEFTLPFNL